VAFLETEGLVTRLAPAAVVKTHEDAITKAIVVDLADPEFEELCTETDDRTGRSHSPRCRAAQSWRRQCGA
jgi:hypothetical protein